MCSKRRGNLIVGSARKELLATAVTLVNQQFGYAKLVELPVVLDLGHVENRHPLNRWFNAVSAVSRRGIRVRRYAITGGFVIHHGYSRS